MAIDKYTKEFFEITTKKIERWMPKNANHIIACDLRTTAIVSAFMVTSDLDGWIAKAGFIREGGRKEYGMKNIIEGVEEKEIKGGWVVLIRTSDTSKERYEECVEILRKLDAKTIQVITAFGSDYGSNEQARMENKG